MKIAIIGYGKMGKNIEAIAIEKNHFISYIIDKNNQAEFSKINKENTNVIIEFSTPNAAYNNIKVGLQKQIPVVSGTTGWLDKKNEIEEICKKNNTAFLYASNFSIGMNLFFELNKNLSKIISKYPEYISSIEETHHLEKKDNPSGTSLTLSKALPKNTEIISNRKEGVIGVHKVKYVSDIDDIEIIHNSKSRKGFALGALMAAEWIEDKKGIFEFKDIL